MCHFGHIGGADLNLTFVIQRTASVTIGKSKERKDRISKASMLTIQKIISMGYLSRIPALCLENLASSLVTPSLRKIGSYVTETISSSAR